MSTDKKEYGISVIIPCYNVGQYVEETLKSVLNQSFKDYEIICLNDGSTDGTLEILNKYNIEFKILENNSTLYSKDGEEISKFLAFIGANFSVLKFEDIRVFREMRNNVNRLVNCETANINKIATAAAKQIAAINKIKKMGKFDSLPDNLKEIAEVREIRFV